MELHIRYWSPVHNEVWIRYYSSEFFGHAEGATVANAIVSAVVDRRHYTRDFQFTLRNNVKISEHASNFNVSNYA